MSSSSGSSQFLQGMRTGFPVVLASAPFGLLFGALAVDAGFSPLEAMAMSALVFAGASQMVGLELYGGAVVPWLVVLSIFAVNFRHVLYSAAVGPKLTHWPWWQQATGFFFLTDPQFAETERRGEFGDEITFGWYMGAALTLYLAWVAEGWLGALFGKLIPNPHALGLDFMLPLYFLGMVIGFRKRPFWAPVMVASAIGSILAYKVVGSPWHVSLGALAGVAVAVIFDPHGRGKSAPVPGDAS
ncbi:MAG: AzlC family ABC transporter permease [Notoacmeibacter sp.]|nr:AzlC family ABC transporter permease [Notoacmeibacter sp.]MCC0032060.1 AzlC family ABC transporter permease [Brucellaceae bacterium]